MIVASGWTIDRSTKVIAYVGDDHSGAAPSYATVIEFHRWLQDLADNAYADPASSDELDITNVDPSRRSTDNIITLINGYTIGATEAEHLYDGSIIMNGGDDIWDGIVNFGNADVQIQLIQNGSVIADDWWNYNGAGLNANATAGISHRFMIKVRTAGVDIDGRRLIGIARRYGYTYSEFRINGTARGNNVLALTDSTDLNNTTALNIISGYTEIQNLFVGYNPIDVDNNGTPEYYYSQWTRSGYTINQFYERMKYLTRDGMATTLYGLAGELFRGITHEINYGSLTGTFDAGYPISWTGGTGQVLASNDSSKVWIQLLTGIPPVASDALTQSSPDAASATVTSTQDRVSTLSFPFVGASTGSAIIGAYGVGIKALDLKSSDKVTDLAANVVTPPNYVTNTVASLGAGVDYVLVAPWSGATDTNGDPAIWKNQLLLQSGLTTDNITQVTVSTLIPSDTPSAGTIRVTDDDGFERRLAYTGWTSYTFDIVNSDGQEDFASVNAAQGNYVYITYIDALTSSDTISFTGVQTGSRSLVVIVRDGGAAPIKQFISSWSYTSSNQTINAIRTTDV
jgi:hypothetical protein